MFASVDLSRRIDSAEARLCAEVARAVQGRRPEVRVLVEEVAGGLAVYAGQHSPTNKMIGAGFDGGPDETRLEVVERRFAERKARLQAEVSTLANPAFPAALSARGYALQGFENVLGRALTSEDGRPAAEDRYKVDVLPDDEIASWAEMLVTGFEHPDTEGVPGDQLAPRAVVEQIIGDMSAMENLRRYVIRVDGVMVAGAGMRLDNRIAQFTGSATLPSHRRRGMQTAFLRRRLADALELGCELAVVTTAPGSKSQQNAQRQGFCLLYSRALLVWAPAGA